jgi:sigma-B regulation protein RsbU (phosphoserine phosphatase)
MPHVAPVIVMTAWSTVPLAVEAMRLGAVDFIEKPWDNMRLLSLLKQHLSPNERRPQAGLTAAADLEIARTVQNRLLPQEWPRLKTLDYAVKYQPAGLVGGDYYDFLPSGEDALTFVVADVSGKGISAAILMATIQSFFRSREPREFSDLAGLVGTLNTLFLQSSPAEQYATLFVMRYAEATRHAEWINCGHTPPLLCKPGRRMEELGPTATVLGMFPAWEGRVERCAIDAGDTLLIFSDGLVEATNERYEEFGTDRLHEQWGEWKALAPRDLVQAIGNAIRDHSDGPLSDDLTILALRGRAAHGRSESGVAAMALASV